MPTGSAGSSSNAPLRRGRSAARDAVVEEELTCPLCMDLPGDAVHRCANGHKFCASCLTSHRQQNYSGASKCPTCRVELGADPIRDRAAEARIGRLPGCCDGCGAGMLRKDLTRHMATCGDVVVDCPHPACNTRVKRRDLPQHMQAYGDVHLRLSQMIYARLVRAEVTLGALAVGAEIALHSTADVAAGNLDGTEYFWDRVMLNCMEPIEEQAEFRSFFDENDLVRAHCTVSVDTSKTPHELGVAAVSSILISIDAGLLPPRLVARRDLAQQPSLNVKVVTDDGHEIFFKCKPDTMMRKVMEACCNRLGLSMDAVRFLFDGERILPEHTPRILGIEDGDTIDMDSHPTGGVNVN